MQKTNEKKKKVGVYRTSAEISFIPKEKKNV